MISHGLVNLGTAGEYLWGLCFFCEVWLNFHTAARAQAIVLLLSTEADNRCII